MNHVTSFPELIAKWPSISALAEDMGVGYPTAAAWKLRKSIPPKFWPVLIAKAERRGANVTLEQLVAWRPQRAAS